ncbi:MAG: aminodeoxyfutalosine deaminase [Verrucomicrobiota bacterium]
MIIRSRVVAPMAGEPIDDGAVAVEGNRIAGVGKFVEVKRDHRGEVLDLGEQILLPGLINAHCHLDYTALRGKIGPQRSFADWILAINAQKDALTGTDYVSSITAGLAEAQSFGTTTLLNLEAFPELLPHLSRPPLRVWWCAELIDLRRTVDVNAVSEMLRAWFHSHQDWLGGFGLAPHAPYTASPELYSEAAQIARTNHLPFTTHLAESHEEMQMFRDGSGPLFEFLRSIGRPMSDDGTPVAHLMRTAAIDEHWIVAHLNELTEGDFELLERGPKFQITHCPRSHTFFAHAPFAWEKLRALGFNIALGTDSLASNSSLSLFAEMRELQRKEPWLPAREVLAMVTVNAAAAVGQSNSLGRIRPGFYADLIGLPALTSEGDVFEKVIGHEGIVPWMMANGEVLCAS